MGTGQQAATRDVITLKGSSSIVGEFFSYAVNSILFQRGLYPSEQFDRVKKYGLTMLVSHEDKVKGYISAVTSQIADWLQTGKVQRVVMVISSLATKEVLERWNFLIETDRDATETGATKEKSDKEIMQEIQAIMRQITSSVTFLPHLEESCSFELLVYTDTDLEAPTSWEESDPRLIKKAQEVKLRSLNTKIHKIDSLVAYKVDDDSNV
ncbi:hypothetical protein SELMODRAFT_183832 [Selaginella moellendorffii]|uniref:HORMA domain-containing protein n=1 Tax=Selaginella moellendorffii TaxID=88036 RepID=D8SYE0_SELML|nr:mitotic spindle checkpoint protein MAD2 [Selaginella moellendorffii]EFJ10445.1 hypothetical protein SELMODRAFT_183832 [Selaginella moellendorffii]|eukprot:XP_002988355.1 mitotic spindle checkpoint protein MAD2 [Selaginella moellendorffii]